MQSKSLRTLRATSISKYNKSVVKDGEPALFFLPRMSVIPRGLRGEYSRHCGGFVIGVREFQLRIMVRNQRARARTLTGLLARRLSRRGASTTVRSSARINQLDINERKGNNEMKRCCERSARIVHYRDILSS